MIHYRYLDYITNGSKYIYFEYTISNIYPKTHVISFYDYYNKISKLKQRLLESIFKEYVNI